jgi:hypothetical protein
VNALFEAQQLRQAGITSPIYIMGYVLQKDLPQVVELNCRLVVYQKETVKNHFEWMGCGPAGRVRFLLQRNEWSSLNQDFQNIGRGQRFVMPDYQNTKGYRLDEIVTVKKSDVIKIL